MTEDYVAGHFPKAWKALKKEYKDTKTVLKASELRETYNELKMKKDENPTEFITKLKTLRSRQAEVGLKIEEKTFMMDTLGKLPKSKKKGELGPYSSVVTIYI